ncbi:hypothetical protein ACTXT7_007489 [Hymenolepis weldensis]
MTAFSFIRQNGSFIFGFHSRQNSGNLPSKRVEMEHYVDEAIRWRGFADSTSGLEDEEMCQDLLTT